MVNVGLVSPFLPEKDGIALYSADLLKGMGEKVVTIGRAGGKADYTVDFGSFSLKKQLARIVSREKLDVLHIQYVPALFGKFTFNLNLLAVLRLPCKVVLTFHEVHYAARGLKDRFLMFLERKFVRGAAAVIVHTPEQRDFLKKFGGNVVHIYQGLWDYPVKDVRGKELLFFGMISKGKGVEHLIKAMELLPDFHLQIAGRFVDGDVERSVTNALGSGKKNISTDFRWIDEKTKKQYFSKASIVVLPYIWGPYQSAVLHNALSYGKPVVVSDVGSLAELLNSFTLGEKVRAGDGGELANGIKKVYADYGSYSSGIAAYRKVADWKQVGKEHLRLYTSLGR